MAGGTAFFILTNCNNLRFKNETIQNIFPVTQLDHLVQTTFHISCFAHKTLPCYVVCTSRTCIVSSITCKHFTDLVHARVLVWFKCFLPYHLQKFYCVPLLCCQGFWILCFIYFHIPSYLQNAQLCLLLLVRRGRQLPLK